MKILIAGQFKEWALERHFARYWRDYAEVDICPIEDIFDDYYHHSYLNKIQFLIGLSDIYAKIGRALLEKANAFQPDIIFITKGMRTPPNLLKKLKRSGHYIVNYNPDHPFIFSSRGSGNKNVTNSIGLFDLHLCYSSEVQQRIEREYGVVTDRLPFGFELSPAQFVKACKAKEEMRLCFIGNPDPIRVRYIMALANSGLPLDVYGHGWSKVLKSTSNLRMADAVYGDDFWKKMRSYRVQLNIFRPHNEGSHNMRTFEIPAVGGIALAPESADHREFFTEGKEIFLYENQADLIRKAHQLLDLSYSAANAIRQNARQRSVQSDYSYKHRAKQAFGYFQQLIDMRTEQKQLSRVLPQ